MKSETPILLQTLVLSINHWWYAQTFLIFEPGFHWFKIWACYYLLKSRLYLKFDFLHPFSCSNVCLQAYAYINNLYLIIYYRTIKYVSEKIFKKFCYMKLNVKDYTAVSVSVILPLSKMQQKPSKAAKAPYIQLSSLEGKCNFLMYFKGRNQWFSLKLHLKIVFSKNKYQIFKLTFADMIMK